MSGCPITHLTLPQWDGGSRKIRFIYLVNVTSFRLTKCPQQGPVIPLYLGADLLSNTGIRTENHPRYHAKFAKKGFATKIHFSSAFRFQGLRVPAASNSLWFYSIQGLFRLAFEMYSKQEQLTVLENLQDSLDSFVVVGLVNSARDIWKSQINDEPLKLNYHLSAQLDPLVSSSISVLQSNSEISEPHSMVGELMDVCSSDKSDTSVDHDYCSFPKHSLQSKESNSIVFTLKAKLQSLDDQLSFQPHTSIERLETILLLLENIDRYMKDNFDEKDAADTVLALLMAKDFAKDSVYSSYLLTCIGRWLGQQFHAANSSISQKVECFKVQHIEQISDLPPAEELITELFPEAMQTLLLHWMGLCEESTQNKRRSEYPILLLILEFANHNLITGVAHVLYSSLICK